MIRDFEYRESDLKIFESEFSDRLPEKIYDSHVHLWAKDNLNIPRSEYAVHKVYKPWTDFDYMEEFLYEDYLSYAKQAFPGKMVMPMAFGSPFPQVGRDRTNAYVMDTAKLHNMPFFYIPGQFENMFETEQKLHLLARKGFLGLKPYPDIPVVEGREAGIYDMLNRSALEYADEHGLYIVLHIPRKARLRSEDNRRELIECVTRYRNAKFIIAHVGRAFTYYDAEGMIDFLFPYENVLFDTALINSETVLAYLMKKADTSKILFGSDAPLAFSRGRDVTINNRHYYVSETSVPWGLSYGGGPLTEFTFYIYEEIRAMLYASKEVFGKSEAPVLEKVFYKNAASILERRS